MGNEPSSMQDGGGKDFEKDFQDTILPPMVLIIDQIVWPVGSISQAAPDKRPGSGRLTPPASSAHGARIWCSAWLDGVEIGQPVQFPLPPLSVGGPTMKVIPQTPGSVCTLKFRTDAGAEGLIRVPLHKLIRYGAPLYTSLWLGLPVEGDSGYEVELADALSRGQNPDVAKCAITIFRPARNQDFHGMAVDPQPDIQSTLQQEDMDTCTGPVKRGPGAAVQIKGLVRALRLNALTTLALQTKLFEGGMASSDLSRQLQETVLSLTPKIKERDPDMNMALTDQVERQLRATEDRAARLADQYEDLRRANTQLEVEKASLEQRLKLQTEHWQQQQQSNSAELQALREADSLRQRELDRYVQDLEGLNDLRKSQEQNQEDLNKASNQLEELHNLRSQVQTHRGQQLYLQRELTLATEELQSLRALEGQRKSLSQDHAAAQDELVRVQVALDGERKELAKCRDELKNLPALSSQAGYLDSELKLAREKVESLSSENKDIQQELARAKATAEALSVEKDKTTKMLEDHLARANTELETLRARDTDRPSQVEELTRCKVELEVLRQEKQQWKEDLENDSQRWNNELEALRVAHEKQVELQEERNRLTVELEAVRMSAQQQQSIHNDYVQKSTEIEVRNKVEGAVLEETLDKLKKAAPQKLKDLRAENQALKEKDKERIQLKEENTALRLENLKQLDEIKELKQAETRTESRLKEAQDDMEKKKSELLNMRAEREVLRTGDILRQELVDENLAMREELDRLKKKDGNTRKDLQDQLARACSELSELRGSSPGKNTQPASDHDELGSSDAWRRQKQDPSSVINV